MNLNRDFGCGSENDLERTFSDQPLNIRSKKQYKTTNIDAE